jgi:uncharacterized membrane protein affecting hemolysin expression
MMRQPPMAQAKQQEPTKEEVAKILHHQLISVITSQNKYLYQQLDTMKESHKKTQKTIENMAYILYALLGITALIVILLIVFYCKMMKN